VPAETSIIAEPGTRTIVMMRAFDAPRAVVFEAWTRPEHVARWWDPGGVPLQVCEIDLRPNGVFRWVNRGPDGKDYPFSGIYREIAAPERLVFTSSGSVATLIFVEDAGKTKLTMTIECPTIEDRDALLRMRVDVGTARTLDNLAKYVGSMPQ
jgi:uncharacterized protein YndB with AHSA1/START domain